MKKPEDLLGSNNYFHWEFNMRMTLARKGLIAHIEMVKPEAEWTDDWRLMDQKAFGYIAQGISLEHQTKIRSARTAQQAWATLRDFYNRSTLHNRVALTRRLHEFRLEAGSDMAGHLDRFDELVVSLQTTGEVMDEARQLVVLLGSLPNDYDVLVSIVESTKEASLIDVKEKLLKEYERHQKHEATEQAFKAQNRQSKRGNWRKGSSGKGNSTRVIKGFKGKCYLCNKFGHMKKDCPNKDGDEGRDEVVFTAGTMQPGIGWLIDSGASSHMTPFLSGLFDYKTLAHPIDVTIADGQKLQVFGTGSARMTSSTGFVIHMQGVLHIPRLDRRLLSIGKLTERGLSAEFGPKQCNIWQGIELVVVAERVGTTYTMSLEPEQARQVEYLPSEGKWELWHARMGHPSQESYTHTQRVTEGMPVLDKKPDTLCGGCMKGKQTVTKFPSQSTTRTSQVLELVHTDLMGPIKPASTGGAKYVLVFVDDFSHLVVVYFLSKKSEVTTRFREFKAMYENQLSGRIKCIRSDNGTEFVNKIFDELCQNNGIVHQRTVPYSSQQNGTAERMNRTIMEKARSMVHYKGVALRWWAEAVNTAVYLINRTTNTAHSEITPYELCFGVKCDDAHAALRGDALGS